MDVKYFIRIIVRKRSCGKVMFLHLSVIVFTRGQTPQADPPADIPPPRQPLKRAVRILLEFILVGGLMTKRQTNLNNQSA